MRKKEKMKEEVVKERRIYVSVSVRARKRDERTDRI